MNLRTQITAIEKRMKNRVPSPTKLYFFDGEEEYQEALKSGKIVENSISFIDDFGEDDS